MDVCGKACPSKLGKKPTKHIIAQTLQLVCDWGEKILTTIHIGEVFVI